MSEPRFDGAVYDPFYDDTRLTKQIGRVYACMIDGSWRTLLEIAKETADPEISISAHLRHLRRPRFGAYVLEKRARRERCRRVYEYRLLRPANCPTCGTTKARCISIRSKGEIACCPDCKH